MLCRPYENQKKGMHAFGEGGVHSHFEKNRQWFISLEEGPYP